MFKVSVVLLKCSQVPIPVDMYVCSRNYMVGLLERITVRNDSQSKMFSTHHIPSRFSKCSSGGIFLLSVQAWV